MLGSLLTAQVKSICVSFGSGKRSTFNPQPLLKALDLTPQDKAKQTRSISQFLNSSKYKNIMKQLEKEFDIALTK